jgi:hypothetical protein
MSPPPVRPESAAVAIETAEWSTPPVEPSAILATVRALSKLANVTFLTVLLSETSPKASSSPETIATPVSSLKSRSKVLSADRSPPPDRPLPAVRVLVKPVSSTLIVVVEIDKPVPTVRKAPAPAESSQKSNLSQDQLEIERLR